ncbi:MAG: hydantoinase B/oxoprolinase family protein [Anaerolineae bacterium]|nr:MAG: hydantoinase B/oxoprolinase family protein [Anaerolineae bacterium]
MAIDPITTEIIRNAFVSTAQDMNATLIRSAYTPIIYEGKDCSVALLDEHGNVLGQSLGLPLFLGNLEVCVKLTGDLYGWDIFKPGDIFHMNDSYLTGTHLNDSTIFAPIYSEGRLVGFSATRAHWLDVGAKDPGGPMDSHEIYQEGTRWPPTKIYENFGPREDIIEILRRNSRFGHGLVGDMNAQVAACRTGEKRLQALLERFGYDTVLAARDEIFRQSEQLEREAVAAIPDGVYTSEGFLDNDGLGSGPIAVKVKVIVEGDQMTVDLDGSAEQTRGPVNCGFPQTISAVRVAFKLLVNPDRPVDGGTFKTLTVKAPEGSIFYAQEPAACQWYFSSLGLLIDLIPRALAPALPDRVAGAHYGDSMVIYVAGTDPRKGDIPFLSVEANPGGWGAFETNDGQDALINNVNGGFKDYPVEVYENKYPVVLRRYGFRADTGGPGRFRGGTGIYREYHLEAPASVYLWFERSVTKAWGLLGGGDGVGPDVVINPGTEGEQHLLKVNALPVDAGGVVRLYTGGGGGFGNAWERDPALVREDVIDGYVTRQGAERDYGVVLKDDLSIDEKATEKQREALRKEDKRPV